MTSWAWTEDGWRHRPWWKVAINSLLRAVQRRGEGRKLVVFTRCGPDPAFGPPTVRGYGIGFIYHLPVPVETVPRASVGSPWWRRLLTWPLRPRRRALPPARMFRPYVAPAVTTFEAIAGSRRDGDGCIDYDIGDGIIYRRPPCPTSLPSGGVPCSR